MRRLALLACVVALVLAGCGGDEEKRSTATDTQTAPTSTSTAPKTTTAPPSTPAPRTETQGPSTVTAPESGGTPAPMGKGKGREDSPQNDIPPPKGSPQERFEKQCKKHPSACG